MAAAAPEIQSQLERILASKALAGSDQLKRFLRLAVERALSGQQELLKEYNLGLEVFHRPPDYDPKTDPIVRVQARRLRAKLDEYYAGEGQSDTVIIQIPKGAYTPTFEPRRAPMDRTRIPQTVTLLLSGVLLVLFAVVLAWRARETVTASADRDRSVAVLPLRDLTGDPSRAHIPERATEAITTELAKNGRLRVLSHTTASRFRDTKSALPDIASSLGVRWVVEGGVGIEGDRVYVKLRAVDATMDRKVWADTFDADVRELIPAATRAAGAIGQAVEARASARQQ